MTARKTISSEIKLIYPDKKEKIQDFSIDTESKNVQDIRPFLSLKAISKIAEEVKLTSIT